MLPDRPATVNSVRAAVRSRMRRGQRKLWVALVVLAAHALLLGLLWNGQSARIPPLAPRPALIEISLLAPAEAAKPAPAKRPSAPATSATSRPSLAAPAARQTAQEATGKPASRTAPDTGSSPSPVTAAAAAPPQLAMQGSNAAPVRIERPDSSADYLDNPRPAYPALSRRLGEQGQVLLRVWVEADGRPGQVELRRGSGFDRLDRAALQAVQRWRFVPGQRAGVPEAMWAEVPLQFTLE